MNGELTHQEFAHLQLVVSAGCTPESVALPHHLQLPPAQRYP